MADLTIRASGLSPGEQAGLLQLLLIARERFVEMVDQVGLERAKAELIEEGRRIPGGESLIELLSEFFDQITSISISLDEAKPLDPEVDS